MRVFLTGFMASGKTTVGRALARLLEARFVDLDRAIEERAGASVREIFGRDGEEGFRRLEREELARVVAAGDDPLVVATGGGTIVDERNRRLMAENGRIVWLDPGFEVLSTRLTRAAAGERPLFSDREQARRLLERRLGAYRRADIRLEIAAAEGPHQVASRILDRLSDPKCDT